MTRAEQKALKIQKENEFIESIKGKRINQDEKNKFRKTTPWLNARKEKEVAGYKVFKNGKKRPIRNVDYITKKPLGKRWNLHHIDLNPAHYTDLNPELLIPLNPGMHDDVLHYLYSLMCKDRTVLDRLIEVLNKMGEVNNWKDVGDFEA